ncbi:hypothetical protein ASD84_20805, partial [Nocardioides sp. Root682]|uniref:hypothetical protein n=1 Tax=Nocardioides sp. Root682 TaxID=1736586 RepID=UPI0006FECDE8
MGQGNSELTGRHESRPAGTLLSRLSDRLKAREESLVEDWTDLVTWANQHTVTTPEQAATIIDGVIDTGVP